MHIHRLEGGVLGGVGSGADKCAVSAFSAEFSEQSGLDNYMYICICIYMYVHKYMYLHVRVSALFAVGCEVTYGHIQRMNV